MLEGNERCDAHRLGADAAPTGLGGLVVAAFSTKISLLTELAATTGNAANRPSVPRLRDHWPHPPSPLWSRLSLLKKR